MKKIIAIVISVLVVISLSSAIIVNAAGLILIPAKLVSRQAIKTATVKVKTSVLMSVDAKLLLDGTLKTYGFDCSDPLFAIADELGYKYTIETNHAANNVELIFMKEYADYGESKISITCVLSEKNVRSISSSDITYMDDEQAQSTYVVDTSGAPLYYGADFNSDRFEFTPSKRSQLEDYLRANADAPSQDPMGIAPQVVRGLIERYRLDCNASIKGEDESYSLSNDGRHLWIDVSGRHQGPWCEYTVTSLSDRSSDRYTVHAEIDSLSDEDIEAICASSRKFFS